MEYIRHYNFLLKNNALENAYNMLLRMQNIKLYVLMILILFFKLHIWYVNILRQSLFCFISSMPKKIMFQTH